MVQLCLLLVLVGLVVSLPATALARALGRRTGAFDTPPLPGQVKMPARPIPNTGGIGIFAGVALPVLAGLAWLVPIRGSRDPQRTDDLPFLPADLHEHVPGIADRAPMALGLLGALLAMHVLGLVDDRRPLGPGLKLLTMLGVGTAVVLGTDTRLLTVLDGPAGGSWLSVLLTVLWLAAVTNAMNFLDNMDGLAAGVGATATACFLAAALVSQPPQWFVAALLALLLGALLGFLWFNFPILGARPRRATIFMGDGGSLVVGFLLGFLTARTTYYTPAGGGAWYGVLMPVVVLAVPLYDLAAVTAIRLWQGRSPLVGDLNHLSHRLVRRGLSRRSAVLVIWGLTAATAIGGISLGRLEGWQAALVGAQTALVLGVLAVLEFATPHAPSHELSPAERP